MPKFSKALSILLGLAILGSIGVLAYISFLEPDYYTEFYILGQSGKAEAYPEILKVGEEGTVTLGIISREKAVTTYDVEVRIDGVTAGDIGPIVLENGAKYEGVARFTPQKSGKEVKIEFLLLTQGRPEIHNSLYLLVDVEG